MWKWKQTARAEAAPPEESDLAAAMPAPRWEPGAPSLDPAYRDGQTSLDVEVDDGVSVAVTAQNAAAVLEMTQRYRERRDRERSSLPPVYNFGREGTWSGGGEW